MSTAEHEIRCYQHGLSQSYTAACGCGWQTTTGSMKAARDAAREHQDAKSCLDDPPAGGGTGTAEVVPVVAAPPAAAPGAPPAPGVWNNRQADIIRRSVAPGATDDELRFFAQVCQHKGLDPFAGEIIAVHRKTKQPDGQWAKQMVIQETVAGLRALAERSGLYDGQGPPEWCGPDGRWLEVWLDTKTPPAAARVAVYRKGWSQPTVGVARYASYVQLDRDGKPQGLWAAGPDLMLWKCAEAAALKRAFKHAISAAGASTREFSAPERISMEARRVGLDDDGRHALVAEVTDGRTESTRELTDEEALEVRAEIARIAAEHGVDPDTGERVEAEPPAGPDAVQRMIARAAGNLEARMDLLTGDQQDEIKFWRKAQNLARPLGGLTPDERLAIAAELDRRGWGLAQEPDEPAHPS